MTGSRRREEMLVAETLGRLDGCPEADDLQRLHRDELSATEAGRVKSHLAACAACRTAFEQPVHEDGPEATLPVDVAGRSEAWIDAVQRPARTSMGPWMLRAAAILAVGLGLAILVLPRLEDPGDDLGAVRGAGELEPESPVGTLRAAPEELRWSALPDADGYRVELLDSELRPLWTRRTEGPTPSLRLDPDALGQLRPGSRFSWQVQALNDVGRVIAESPVVQFEIAPPGD